MPSDAAAVLAGLVGAADDDVLDLLRVERALLDDFGDDRRQHVVGPHPGESAGVAAEWGAQSVVDVAVEHGRFLLGASPRVGRLLSSPAIEHRRQRGPEAAPTDGSPARLCGHSYLMNRPFGVRLN